MEFRVSFPGGVAVEASDGWHSVRTDQPRPTGNDTAMSPFDLFFASMATCMGYYALRFCQERSISTAGLGLTLETTRDAQSKKVDRVSIRLQAPEGFPEKYREAFVRAVDHCAVKRAVMDPPRFEIEYVDTPVLSGSR